MRFVALVALAVLLLSGRDSKAKFTGKWGTAAHSMELWKDGTALT
jgi:hypothetical protein